MNEIKLKEGDIINMGADSPLFFEITKIEGPIYDHDSDWNGTFISVEYYLISLELIHDPGLILTDLKWHREFIINEIDTRIVHNVNKETLKVLYGAVSEEK